MSKVSSSPVLLPSTVKIKTQLNWFLPMLRDMSIDPLVGTRVENRWGEFLGFINNIVTTGDDRSLDYVLIGSQPSQARISAHVDNDPNQPDFAFPLNSLDFDSQHKHAVVNVPRFVLDGFVASLNKSF